MHGPKIHDKWAEVADSVDLDVESQHQLDNLILFIYTFLLILTILCIWLFKYKRIKYIHETGVALAFGVLVGIMIRFMPNPSIHPSIIEVAPVYANTSTNETLPQYVSMRNNLNSSFLYRLMGAMRDKWEINKFETSATFDPEVFFNIILPPIIFHAGYSMKRKSFFKNFGSILVFAFIGCAIGTTLFGFMIWGFLKLIRDNVENILPNLGLGECILFGAITAATDPVTVLAIFNDIQVDPNLYALVFGESAMNDAIAIVLVGTVEPYTNAQAAGDVNGLTFFFAFLDFVQIFLGASFMGAFFGCVCAVLTKFTKVSEYPLLETSLVILMSYSCFLAAEASKLSGIVTVLFCGITQAHYTYNNLSESSQKQTRQFFELLNFFLENFVFAYMGVSVITMESQHFNVGFFFASMLALFIARSVFIYPLAFFVNLGRSDKIPANYQHMMNFAGLRGPIAFGLAIRNATTPERNVILSTTSLIVMVTVVVLGGLTPPMLSILNIRTGVDDESLAKAIREKTSYSSTSEQNSTEDNERRLSRASSLRFKKSWFHKRFGNFDVRFLKPLLTHATPSLEETAGRNWLTKCLTSDQQRNHAIQNLDEDDTALRQEFDRGETPMMSLGSSEPESETTGLDAANIIIDKDDIKKY